MTPLVCRVSSVTDLETRVARLVSANEGGGAWSG